MDGLKEILKNAHSSKNLDDKNLSQQKFNPNDTSAIVNRLEKLFKQHFGYNINVTYDKKTIKSNGAKKVNFSDSFLMYRFLEFLEL